MGAQELIEKAPDGRWQVRSEEPRDRRVTSRALRSASSELEATPDPKPLELQPPAAHAPWVKSILCYERKETTIVEGQRYG